MVFSKSGGHAGNKILIFQGRFTLWLKVERPSISTKSLASRPFTLWPKSKGCRNLNEYFFGEGDILSKEVRVGQEWKPKLWSRGRRLFFIKKNQSLTRSWPFDWRGYFEQGIKWDAPLGLAFGGFTLCPAEGSTYYILLAMYFQPISLDSQQILATQSHGLLTWTAIS
jgi:hypothetical protein